MFSLSYIVEILENSVEIAVKQSRGLRDDVFQLKFLRVLSNFHSCLYSLIQTRQKDLEEFKSLCKPEPLPMSYISTFKLSQTSSNVYVRLKSISKYIYIYNVRHNVFFI